MGDYDPLAFEGFRKIPRLNRQMILTEKIDGTCSQVFIYDDPESGIKTMKVGSKNRWLTKEADNFGFFNWAMNNREELLKLGYGRHFGEYWGAGIQRGYGLKEKRFSLFNTSIWTADTLPKCCSVVPVLFEGLFTTDAVRLAVNTLWVKGSAAVPGFMHPEGVVIYHVAANQYFKVTLEGDDKPKGSHEQS